MLRPHSIHPKRRRVAGRGYTLLEMMAVIVITGILAGVAYPKLRDIQRRASLNSAKLQLRSYLSTARMTAVRRGSTARLVRSGNVLSVTVDSSATQASIIRPFDFQQAYSVLLSSTVDSVVYTPRGTARGLNAAGEKFYLATDASRIGLARDSVCVTRLGLALEQSCGI